jgi:hypothetical protein
MAQHSAVTHRQHTQVSADVAPKNGLQRFLKSHRRTFILTGAAVLLATYFLKDVANDKAKEEIATMRAAESQYRASLSLQQEQLKKLFDTSQMLKSGDAKSLSRSSVLAAVGDLTLGAGSISHNLFWFAKSCLPGAPEKGTDEAQDVLHRTGDIHGEVGEFLAHPPADAEALNKGAQAIIDKLTNLQDSTAEAGTGLQVYELGALEHVEKKSSWYGSLITALFFLGLVLNTLGALYGLESVKES